MKTLILMSIFLTIPSSWGYSPDQLEKESLKIIKSAGVEKAALIVRDQYHQTKLNIAIGGFDFNTPLPIASSTKWITAAIALKFSIKIK